MLRYRMIVVTSDKVLKRATKRHAVATASKASFVTDVESMKSNNYDIAVFDARAGEPPKDFYSKLPMSCKILHIISPNTITSKTSLFSDHRVTSLFTYDDEFNDAEFVSSVTKTLRGDVFGLDRYFPWGVATFTMVVRNYQDKLKSIEIMMQYAKRAGVRGPTRDRIQLVADELMMNGLYHAPVDENGDELYRNHSRKELTKIESINPIEVQYACSGTSFGLSVRDTGGSLTRNKALSYLMRSSGVAQIEQKKTGAGLGLLSILRSVSNLAFNLDPGHSTEVITIFDMEVKTRGQIGSRSLHIFTEEPEVIEEEEEDGESTGFSASWAVASVLGLVTLGLVGALASKELKSSYGVRVTSQPANASISANGSPLRSNQFWKVPSDAEAVTITVRKKGYKSFKQTLPKQNLNEDTRIFVNLNKAK